MEQGQGHSRHGHPTHHPASSMSSWAWRVWTSTSQQRQVHRRGAHQDDRRIGAPLTKIFKQLRDLNVDIDSIVDEWCQQHNQAHLTRFTKPPSTSSPSWTPSPSPSNPSSSTAPPTRTRNKRLRTPLINYRNFRKKPPSTSKSIDVTPIRKGKASADLEDNLPVQDGEQEEAPTSSQKNKVDPKPKRRRSMKTKDDGKDNSKDNLAKLLTQPFNVLQQSDNIKPPLSLTTLKSWTISIKKIIPEDMHKTFDQHCEKMQTILNQANHKKPALQEMATRWGLPFSLVASAGASVRTLQRAISVITFFAL